MFVMLTVPTTAVRKEFTEFANLPTSLNIECGLPMSEAMIRIYGKDPVGHCRPRHSHYLCANLSL